MLSKKGSRAKKVPVYLDHVRGKDFGTFHFFIFKYNKLWHGGVEDNLEFVNMPSKAKLVENLNRYSGIKLRFGTKPSSWITEQEAKGLINEFLLFSKSSKPAVPDKEYMEEY